MAGDDPLGGAGTDDEPDDERALIAHALSAALRGVPASDVPDALCRTCTKLLPAASGLSVSLAGNGSQLGVTLCAGDEVAARLAEIQYTLGEGPCRQATVSRAPVFATDLTRSPDMRRWPVFSVQAVKAGAHAVFSVPLAGAGNPLGTLDLYREAPGPLRRAHLRTTLLLADAVTRVVIALEHASPDPDGVGTWLAAAKTDRQEVHRATGMIMVQLGVSAEESLLRLRASAFAQGRTATEVARDIVERTMDIGDVD